MNLNHLAIEITLKEKGKKQVNIAQVKEIMKIIFTYLSRLSLYQLASILKKY